jgi:hypothetical protein
MSIKRINEFPGSSGSLTNDDIFLFMDNPGSSGVTKKISLMELSASLGSSSASLPASGLSITLGGGWYPPGFMPIFNYVVPQAFSFGSTYTKYTGKWIGSFSYSETGYTVGTRLTSITFSDLEGVTGNFSPTTCGVLTSLTADSLAYVGGNFAPSLASLTALSCSNLKTIVGTFNPSIGSVTSLSFPSLVYVGGSFSPTATTSDGTLSFPNLAYIGGSLSASSTGPNSAWSFPSLTYIGSTLSASFGYFSSLSFPSLSYIGSGGISLVGCPNITTISLPALAYCYGGISFNGTTALTSITLPVDGTLKVVAGSVTLSGTNNVTQASIDNILQALASLDGTNGTTSYGAGRSVNLSGGTISAPSNAGSVNVTLATSPTLPNLSCSGTTCTVNLTAHGYATGDVLRVSGVTGATNANIYAVITVVNANQFTYTVATQTATGAGTATVVKAAASAKALITRGVTLTTN